MTGDEERDMLRAHLAEIERTLPEAGRAVRVYIEEQDETIRILGEEEPFRGFVLAQARQLGQNTAMLDRIDRSILSRLAAAELRQAEADAAAASAGADKAATWKVALSQPVILALVTVLSTVLGGIMTAALHLLGATPG